MSHSCPQNAIEVTGDVALPQKEWSQITITYNGSSKANGISIFINGEKQNQTIDLDNLYKGILHEPNIHTYGFGGITFGARGKFTPFKDGGIDDITVFDKVLTPIEVLFSYDNKKALEVVNAEGSEGNEFLKEYYNAYANEEIKTIEQNLKKSREEENSLVNDVPEIMVMGDLPKPRKTYVLKRGEYGNLGEEVEPDVPEGIFKSEKEYPKNRLGLSQYLHATAIRLILKIRVPIGKLMIFIRSYIL